MPAKQNPLGLNALQLKTLTLVQELARGAEPEADGSVRLGQLPQPHGDHFHLGNAVVATRDASGLGNPAVWVVLERKGLVRENRTPWSVTLTAAGLAYDTGPAQMILHHSDH
jgi:hypothetical protein